MENDGSNTTILSAVVVNDDPTQLRFFSGLLEKEGLIVSDFETAEEALAAMNHHNPPDIIVTDLYMPGIDGWRFCRLLRSPEYKHLNKVPILMVSATFAGEHVEGIATDLGANAFLPLPVDGKQFIKQVRAMLAGERASPPLKVLVVEDDKSLANSLKITFEAHGYRVDMAFTATQAGKLFQSEKYDVAVLAYHLPDSRGDSLLVEFLAQRPDCICLVMTNDPNPELALAWMRKGAAAYLHKPFEPEYLIELCAKAHRERVLLRVEDLLEQRTLELRASEHLLRTTIDSLGNAVYLVDRDLRVVLFNKQIERWCEQWGVHLGTVGSPLQAAFPFLSEEILDQYRRVLETGHPISTQEETELGGRLIITETHKRPVMDGNEVRNVLTIVSDISERKKAEEQTTRFSRVLESSLNEIYIFDAETLHFVEVNRGARENLGYSLEELRGLTPLDLKPEFTAEMFAELVEPLRAGTEETIQFNTVHRRKDGTCYPAEIYLQLLQEGPPLFCATILDVTERQRAEEALRESENRYRMMIAAVTAYTYSVEVEAGKAVSTRNGEGCLAVTGYRPEDYESDPNLWHSMIYPQDKEVVCDHVSLVLAGEDVPAIEHRITHRDGSVRWVRVTIVLFRNSSGQLIRYDGLVEDITERKRAEEALRESEALNKAILNNLPVGIAVNSVDSSVIVEYMNDNFPKFYRTTREALAAPDTFWKAVYEEPEFREEIKKRVLDDCASGDPEKMYWEDVPITRKGEEVSFITARNIPVPGKQLMISTVWDVTERKRAEEALRESEGRFRLLLEEVPTIAIQGYGADGTVNYWNRANESVYGYTREEALGKNLLELVVPPEMRDEVRRTIARGVETGKMPPAAELSLMRKDGSRVSVISSHAVVQRPGREVELFCLDVDITDRKRAEEALRESEAKLNAMLQSIGDHIRMVDKDLNILWANETSKEAFGAGIVGRKCYDICHYSNSRREPDQLSPCLALNAFLDEKVHEGDIYVTEKNGDVRCYHCTASVALRDEEGRPATVIEISRDTTERNQLEEERAKASKLESIGILAGGIAHDFNNILTTILINISLAKMMLTGDSNEEIRERLTLSENAGKRATGLTYQLLTFSKGGEPVKEIALLEELIKESTGFSLRGSNVRSRHYLDKDLWSCEIDKGQISQVVNNLVINADQAMPNGGTISVYAKNVVIDSRDALPLEPDKYVKITIKDQGYGIPEDYLPKIFDPYFTTKQKGSGLGLATCYSIVKRHGGHIAVESEQNAGTSFHVYLPASLEQVPERKETKEEADLPKGKILVMDDEQEVFEAAVRVLERLGQKAEGVTDGVEAVKLYKKAMKSGKPFDVVILDLTIPGGMGGKETIEKLRKIDPDVRAIVSSGYSNDPVMSEPEKFGFRGVVPKPYKIGQLRGVLCKVMQETGG